MVVRTARRGANAGGQFYGCQNYPDCHGTLPLPASPLRFTPDVAFEHSLETGVAGGSARATYERRLELHRGRLRDRRPEILASGAVILVFGVIWAMSGQSLGPIPPVFGVYTALLAILWTIAQFVRPQHVRAWETGAVGEERTAEALRALPAGWIVLHDRRIPRSRANIDHVVIGPPGVFLIDSKSYAGQLTIDGGELRVNGRRVKWIDGLSWQRAIVDGLLADAGFSSRTVPVLCVHRADLPWLRRDVQGVAIRSGKDLVPWLLKQPVTFEAAAVAGVSRAIKQGLPPVSGR